MTAALALFAVPVLAADSSAIAFVTRIYDTYKGSGAQGLQLDSERAVGAISSRRLPRSLSRTEKRPRVTARSASSTAIRLSMRRTGISTSSKSMSPMPEPVRQRRQ